MTLPHGAFAPIPTPLDREGSVDPGSLERHLEFLADGGLDGVLVLGTNGEFPSLDVEERLGVAEAAARFSRGLSLMLGIGSCALPEVIRLAEAARGLGYQSVLVPPPFYFRPAPESGLVSFFQRVLDHAEVPVLLYHIPQVTGVPITDALLEAVVDHPRFGGVKDSSGDEEETARFLRGIGNRSYMVGHDRLLSSSRAAGGAGSITASASVVPGLVAAAQRDATRQPELDRARTLLESYGLGPAVKTILRHKGIGDYRSRPPLIDLDDDAADQLVSEFAELMTT